LAAVALLSAYVCGGLPAWGVIPPERPGDERQKLPEYRLREKPAAPALQPPPAMRRSEEDSLASSLKVYVKAIHLNGNSVFSSEELAPVIAPYQGRTLDSDDLQAVRQALTLFYVNRGYINSGALIPDQKVEGGVIRMQIVEGRLTGIELAGNVWLRDGYIRNRVESKDDPVLDVNRLQDKLQILQQDSLIDRLSGELRPGRHRGEAVLRLDVKERRPYELGVSFNNRRSPTVGSLRGEVYGTLLNLTGYGDSLGARFGKNEGLEDISAFYSLPLTAKDTRLRLYHDHSDAEVVEEEFKKLDIVSRTDNFGLGISHPFYRTPSQQFLAEVRFERRQSQTFLLNQPYAFSPGVRLNGKSDVSVVRFGQEWLSRNLNEVLALRSTFNVGLDAFGATVNRSGPDGRFFAWLGQFQWLRRLGSTDMQLLVRADLQLAADPLLPLEKFGVGGMYTVRGYRENLLVRDNGCAASVELRVPVARVPLPWLSERPEDGRIQLAPFFDFGWSQDIGKGVEASDTLYSVGIGARWDPHRSINAQLYWGHALRAVRDMRHTDIQDDGIHFQLGVNLL
jgi:hemolysin activation/secretion protein